MTTTMPILSPSFTFLRLNWIDSKKKLFLHQISAVFSVKVSYTQEIYISSANSQHGDNAMNSPFISQLLDL